MSRDEYYYQFLVRDNQETSCCKFIAILDGYYRTEEQAIAENNHIYNFTEYMYGVVKIEESGIPAWLVGRFMKNNYNEDVM